MRDLAVMVLDKINSGIIVVDEEFNIVFWNNWMERFTKRTGKAAIGSSLVDICPRFNDPLYRRIIVMALQQGQSRFCSSGIHQAFVLPGSEQSFGGVRQNMLVEPIHTEAGKYAMIQIIDITSQHSRVHQLKNLLKEMETENEEMRNTENLIKRQALHDPLTGLANRAMFEERLSYVLNFSRRCSRPAAILFMDLDGFKTINDSHGHLMGDLLLKAVAGRLKQCVRDTDTLARFGGDEFSIILPDIHEEEDAVVVAGKIVDAFREPFAVEKELFTITASIGISIFPDDGADMEDLVKKADKAMYYVKKSWKNGYALYKPIF